MAATNRDSTIFLRKLHELLKEFGMDTDQDSYNIQISQPKNMGDYLEYPVTITFKGISLIDTE